MWRVDTRFRNVQSTFKARYNASATQLILHLGGSIMEGTRFVGVMREGFASEEQEQGLLSPSVDCWVRDEIPGRRDGKDLYAIHNSWIQYEPKAVTYMTYNCMNRLGRVLMEC